VFKNSLRKEGVLHEVSTISKIELKVKAKPPPPPPETSGETGGESGNNELAPPGPAPRRSSSVPSDPQDAYVLRARLIKVKYLTGGSDASGDPAFDSLRDIIKTLADPDIDEDELQKTLKEIAKLFGITGPGISSFELLKSGLVEGLLEFATSSSRKGWC
jgi:E3 ubiquitin-protein ligase TRIP12